MARVGFKGLRYALVTADTAEALTFGTPVLIPQAISMTVTRNSEIVKLYGDDGVCAIDSSAGDSDVEIEIGKLGVDLRAALTGRTATNGRLDISNSAAQQYLALGWIAQNDDGNLEWHWLLKGKLSEPDDSYKTKGDKTEFQTYKLKGSFANTTKTGKSELIMDEGGTGYVAASGATFIATVPTT